MDDFIAWLAVVAAIVLVVVGVCAVAAYLTGGVDENRHNTYDMILGGREYVCKSYPNRNGLTVCKPQNRNVPLP